MAEVYWGMEWALKQQGFDDSYDKRLYDRLREGHAPPVCEHFHAAPEYQTKLSRFLDHEAGRPLRELTAARISQRRWVRNS
jgi:hypothetical protein